MEETKVYEMPKIEISQIDCVYVGKPGKCMCGCSGTYSYTSINREISSKRRGYPVDEEDINDARVLRVLAKVTKNAPQGIEVLNGNIYSLTIGQTVYVVHLID
jgi:hypothetical protein